jgi:hypothetical protein
MAAAAAMSLFSPQVVKPSHEGSVKLALNASLTAVYLSETQRNA